MAKISQYPEDTSPTSDVQFVIAKAGHNYRVSLANVFASGSMFDDAEGDPSNTGTLGDGVSLFAARRDHDHGVRETLTANRTYYVRTAQSTVTMTIASPCVVTWATHGLADDDAVVFTTSGALPTGVVAGTVYYVNYIDTNTFNIAATPDGANINTSGAQSGTHKASTGDNTADGSSNAYGDALLTIQQAVNLAAALDISTYDVTIQLADSVYSETAITLKNPVGAGQVTIQGGTAANVIVERGFQKITTGTIYVISTLTLYRASGTTTYGIYSAYGTIAVTGVVFSSGFTYQMNATQGGNIIPAAAYTISGGAAIHALADTGGSIRNSGNFTVTVSGTPAFSAAFAYSTETGMIRYLSTQVTFSGGATGTRYTAALNAVINTAGGGANYFPGNAAGSTATGGQYA